MENTKIRSLICSVLGHVDHGKSSLLDKIRGTAIVKSEAGAITQAIGASIIPINIIKNICGNLLDKLNTKITFPGLLFIDTPGHAAFTTLRKRGGSLSDIATVVVDINEGFKPQTIEAIEILKQTKTPFIVAANKIDLIPGWSKKDNLIIKNISLQPERVREDIEKKIYTIVGSLSELGFNSERFDRVEDYTKQIAIIPVSAITGEGIPELLMVLVGLAQKFLETSLKFDPDGPAKGTILEVKEEKGLGLSIDVILYDGKLSVNDTIVIGNIREPIVTKVRGLFEPMPLAEMRDKKARFKSVKEVVAATGVKISAPNMENVVAGMPLVSVKNISLDEAEDIVQSDVSDIIIETSNQGVVVKSDSIGSLEAMIHLLKEKNIPIRKASIGNISKKDIAEAETNLDKEPLFAVVLGFNVSVNPDVDTSKVKIIKSDVIYKIIEGYEEWKKDKLKSLEAKELDNVVRPCKIRIMPGYVFRQNNPAIVGVDVLSGILKTGTPLMKDGKEITRVRGIQKENKPINQAEENKQVAVSLENVTVGRQINEGDILYSAIPEDDFRKIKKLTKYLTKNEIETLKEIAEIMRKKNIVWGV